MQCHYFTGVSVTLVANCHDVQEPFSIFASTALRFECCGDGRTGLVMLEDARHSQIEMKDGEA